MTPTEALARAAYGTTDVTDSQRWWYEDLVTKLVALGYEVRPIEQATDPTPEQVRQTWEQLAELGRSVEQAAEAADREAAGNAGTTAPGLAASGFATSAAVAALDVEALAAALVEVEEAIIDWACMSDACDHPEHQGDNDYEPPGIGCGDAAAIAAAYADAIRKRDGA